MIPSGCLIRGGVERSSARQATLLITGTIQRYFCKLTANRRDELSKSWSFPSQLLPAPELMVPLWDAGLF